MKKRKKMKMKTKKMKMKKKKMKMKKMRKMRKKRKKMKIFQMTPNFCNRKYWRWKSTFNKCNRRWKKMKNLFKNCKVKMKWRIILDLFLRFIRMLLPLHSTKKLFKMTLYQKKILNKNNMKHSLKKTITIQETT